MTFRFMSEEGNVVIDAPSWFDARRHAYAALGTDAVTWEATTDPPTVRLTWVGTDAGQIPKRRLVVEELP